MSKNGIIYIVTNPDLPENCVKIGYTARTIQQRLNEFNTAVPHDYEAFATYEVPDISKHKPDQMLHQLFLKLNPGLKINPKKEFFYLYPEEAYELLRYIAIMHDREDKLVLYKPLVKRGKAVSAVNSSTKVVSSAKGNTYTTFNATLFSGGNGTYILKSGSELAQFNGNSINQPYKDKQDELIANGGAKLIKGKIITQVDLSYNNPSGPAQLVHCCSINGWSTWKWDKDPKKSIDDVERKGLK